MTWHELYEFTKENLKKIKKADFRTEAGIIFEHYFKMNRVSLLINGVETIENGAYEKVKEIISKREKNIPLQYILGFWEFMGLKFKVGEGVLIPREDTSVLVEESTKILSKKNSLCIADLCSGSGCVAISLDKKLNNSPKIYAVEISKKAFEYLKENIKINKSGVLPINADVFEVYKKFDDESLDAVVSNPPYVKNSEIESLAEEVKKEPILALSGGEDGLDFYKKICKFWISKLKRGGIMAFEIGAGQVEDVKKIMKMHGMEKIKSFKDINEITRVLIGVKK
ncbi:MAG: peptide chain release factor N(5)-glutamine methyltransferase [Clostridia bacterium]|nr:peptide chain release factor N(5)-glutamine methyltransferase [Clostridia bacterium]